MDGQVELMLHRYILRQRNFILPFISFFFFSLSLFFFLLSELVTQNWNCFSVFLISDDIGDCSMMMVEALERHLMRLFVSMTTVQD